jgi:hypothetical protein
MVIVHGVYVESLCRGQQGVRLDGGAPGCATVRTCPERYSHVCRPRYNETETEKDLADQ